MKRLFLSLALSMLTVTASAANLESPEAKAAFDNLSGEARKLAVIAVNGAGDLAAYCSNSKEDRRQAAATAGRDLARSKEIQGAAVGNLVAEVMAYSGAVCGSK